LGLILGIVSWGPLGVTHGLEEGKPRNAAEPSRPFISQPYDPDRLAAVNSFDPKQKQLDKIRAQARKAPGALARAKVTDSEPSTAVHCSGLCSSQRVALGDGCVVGAEDHRGRRFYERGGG
jgi:hypothetical protein